MKTIGHIIFNVFLMLLFVSCNGNKDEKRDYDRMTDIYDELEQQLSDSIREDYAIVLQSDLYSARFYAQEQQNRIERKRIAMRRTIIFGTAFGLLLIAFAFYIHRQWKKTKRHNQILAQQINEAVEYKEKYKELKPTQVEKQSKKNLIKLTDYELYDYLRNLIESEKLYLDPEFDRQMLMKRTGLTKERLGTAFSHGSDHERITTLVRELRLDYAVHMMNENPDLTIEQICLASGFSNADTFTRNFKAKYDMTPTTYKEMIK